MLFRSLYRGPLVEGPATVDYDLPPLRAGRYVYLCSIHPTMVGTLIVSAR